MQNQTVLYGIIGLLAGSLLTVVVTSNAVNNQNYSMMRMMGMQSSANRMMQCPVANETEVTDGHMGLGSSMTDMMGSLEGLTGDAFDAAFIEAMIPHHQGAIEMAKVAQTNAKHQEIKDLAEDIIEAQNREINQMRQWQSQWGY